MHLWRNKDVGKSTYTRCGSSQQNYRFRQFEKEVAGQDQSLPRIETKKACKNLFLPNAFDTCGLV